MGSCLPLNYLGRPKLALRRGIVWEPEVDASLLLQATQTVLQPHAEDIACCVPRHQGGCLAHCAYLPLSSDCCNAPSIHCTDDSSVPFSTSQGLSLISYSTLTVFCIQESVLRSYVLAYTD